MKMFQEYNAVLKQLPGYETPEVFVDITDSARWFLTEGPGFNTKSFDNEPPVIASPWNIAWLEYKTPSGGVKIDGYTSLVSERQYGALIRCSECVDSDKENILLDERMVFQRLKVIDDTNLRRIENNIDRIRWHLWISLYVENHRDRTVWAPWGAYTYLLDDGSDLRTWMTYQKDGVRFTDHIWLIDPFLFSLGLLHCKNVTLEDVPVPPKVQAKREKRGVPNITFKTLIVEPMRQQVRREAADDPTGEQNHIKRALHIARGHFKDYRDGPGLFGKYQGLYWWDMHVRGSAAVGEVIKDYRVKP